MQKDKTQEMTEIASDQYLNRSNSTDWSDEDRRYLVLWSVGQTYVLDFAYLYSGGRLIWIIKTELRKYIPMTWAVSIKTFVVEKVTWSIKISSTLVTSFRKLRTEPNTMMPANQKLSCWDQKRGSIWKRSTWLMIMESACVIGSDAPCCLFRMTFKVV